MEPKYEILEWKLFQNMLLCRMKQKLVTTYSCPSVCGAIRVMRSSLLSEISSDYAAYTLGKITTSVIGIGISFVFLLVLNIWVALTMAVTTALFFAAFAAAHRVASEEAANQQEAQNKLVGTVIEYIKGMPVVKAFNLAGKSHKATSEDFLKLTEAQIKFEKRFSMPVIVAQCMTGLCISAVIFICGYVGLNGGMEIPFVIAMSVFAFELAAPMLALVAVSFGVKSCCLLHSAELSQMH